jgi:hypothetical protein
MRRLAPLMIIGLLVLAACGQPKEKSYTVTDPDTGEKAKVTVADKEGDKSVTIQSEDGKSTMSVAEAGQAPSNLPDWVPAYPGADYSGSFSVETKGDKAKEGAPAAGAMMGFRTNDPPAKVLDFYKAAFAKAGLKEAASGNFGSMQMLSAAKPDSDIGAQVMVTQDGAASQVQVIYSTAQ